MKLRLGQAIKGVAGRVFGVHRITVDGATHKGHPLYKLVPVGGDPGADEGEFDPDVDWSARLGDDDATIAQDAFRGPRRAGWYETSTRPVRTRPGAS